ncbi:2TM domain-containing protein [Spongiimicrobium salis]|uniref:2TM domain-containing protein n=1 Tax=Spongiimicrobium salis TaxID=1667022 RepID=UPI00374CA142
MRHFLKHLFNAIALGTVISIVLIVISYILGNYQDGWDFASLWKVFYQNMTFSIILYLINAYWLQYLLTNYKKNELFKIKMFALAICGNIVLSVIGVFIARFVLLVGIQGRPWMDFLTRENIGEYTSSTTLATIISLIFYSVWFYKHKQETKVKEQKIIAGTASAKFDALKNQLDPHFLFNSLNVLTSLIEEDPYQAQKFTTSLSKVYRYVLEQKNKDLVTVDEELQFARTYVRLLKMRFEDSIVFEIPEQSTDPEAKIIPLSLQLLLENAVKHNVVTATRPLHIKVFETEGMLVVSNNLQEKQVVKKSSGVGLRNIQQRYGILTDKQVQIHKSAKEFQVKLPMLRKQIAKMETQQSYISDKRYQKAKEKVEAIKGFYGNLLAYCIVIPILIVVNYRTTDFPWAIFPALGWGFGVTAHGLEAFGYNPLFGKQWEERKMREFMDDDTF